MRDAVSRDPRVRLTPADAVGESRIAAIDRQGCLHPRRHGWPSGFFQPVERNRACTVAHHMTLKMDLSNVPDPPPATQRALAAMVAREAEDLKFSAVGPGAQLVGQLELALEFIFLIAFCGGNTRVDDLAVVFDVQAELEAAKVRYLHRIKSSDQGERGIGPAHAQQAPIQVVKRRKDHQLKVAEPGGVGATEVQTCIRAEVLDHRFGQGDFVVPT
jgi:hypothetical protein